MKTRFRSAFVLAALAAVMAGPVAAPAVADGICVCGMKRPLRVEGIIGGAKRPLHVDASNIWHRPL
jgi:hypothetical protein